MENINVRGLPEPVVRALESMVETLRRQMTNQSISTVPATPSGHAALPRWSGQVIGNLTRRESYGDAPRAARQ